ncbi:MAG TPA: PAS domain-containing protein, partial [Rhizomicrobium sp.]|nr:PAS domain-containing protein [Rhizomicrobium sp.]
MFDAIATFFARTLPAASQFTGRPDAAAREPDRSEAMQRFADISGYTAAVVGALTLITVLLSIYDLQALNALPADQGFKGWQSPGVRVLVTLLVLLGIEFALIGALSVQAYSRRRLENLLRESEDRIVFAVDAAALGLWRWESATDSFWATEACNRILGLLPDARYTMAMITESVHPDDRERVANVLRQGLDQLSLFEVNFRLALGREGSRWVRVRAKPSIDARGVLVQLAGTITDITDTMGLRAE